MPGSPVELPEAVEHAEAAVVSIATPLNLKEPLPGHQFPLGAMYYSLELVRSGASLRATAKILRWMLPSMNLGKRSPCYQTVRGWMLRFGLHSVKVARPRGDDWIWIVDHTQQLGDKKVLLIVGMRLSDWLAGRPLEHSDLELLAVLPEAHGTGESLDKHLETLCRRVGMPRAIISDGARDLRLGVTLFCARYPQQSIAWLYDIKHFTAVLLKRELANNPTWKEFTAAANRTKQQCSVTALAALHPPNQRGKARYLNLQELVAWGGKMLTLLDHPHGVEQLGLDAAKCEARLGWLREYREAIEEWRVAMQVVEITETHVRRNGVYRGLVEKLSPQLLVAATSPLSQRLRERLLIHLAEQAEQTTGNEKLPASSEVLESLIGSYKYLQGEQSHHGVTSLVLGMGTLMTRNLLQTIPVALSAIRNRDLTTWCREQLGPTLHGCRQRLHNLLSHSLKPDPQPSLS